MYTHTPMVLQQMSQHSQHQSTARIRVPSGLFGLAEQGLLFEHFFLFQKFRQGGNSWNLFDFDNQSAAFFCVETIKYCSIPSVPSSLEEVKKTRPNPYSARLNGPLGTRIRAVDWCWECCDICWRTMGIWVYMRWHEMA